MPDINDLSDEQAKQALDQGSNGGVNEDHAATDVEDN